MKKLNLIAVMAAGMLTLGITAAVAGASDDHRVASSKADCRQLVIPNDRELNTIFDRENGVIEVTWDDEASGGDVTKFIDARSKSCLSNPSVAQVIEHVRSEDAHQQKELCKSMKDMVDRNVTDVHGRPFFPEQGKRYLAKFCK